jgi:hypothetical protein
MQAAPRFIDFDFEWRARVRRSTRKVGRSGKCVKVRRAATPSTIFRLLLLHWAICMIAPLDAAAQGDKPRFGPAGCTSNPNGMIYVAAGRHVFHQPPGNLGYVHEVSPETSAGLPIAPRPFDPKGCPDHPIRGIGFKFSSFSDVTGSNTTEIAIGSSIQIIGIDPWSWWDTHEIHSLRHARSCDGTDAGGIEMASALRACRSFEAQSAGHERSSFTVIVDPERYAGPLGQPLAVNCRANRSDEVDDHICEMSYRLSQEIGIWYDFRTSLLPLGRLIAFDAELRRRIVEAEVADYWWPVFPGSRPPVPR